MNPLGVEAPHPRLSWTFAGGGGVQRAYQILVATSEQKLQSGDADLWDSGKVISSQTTQIAYDGKPLPSRRRCYWKVRSWDGFYQPTVYSSAASWEMGLLSAGDWKAKWIGAASGWSGARYFRYSFRVGNPVKKARAYIASDAYYELRINGTSGGGRIQDGDLSYDTYDVGGLVKEGENVLGMIGMSKLLLQVEIDYADGRNERFYTDAGAVAGRAWTVSSGPILSRGVGDGEVYDARLEKTGWDLPEASLPKADEWILVQPVEPPPGRLVSHLSQPGKKPETLHPQKMTEPKPGIFVFDAGRSIAGSVELRPTGARGRAVTLRVAQNLAADGTVEPRNFTGVYILKGAPEEKWDVRLSNQTFRYVQVEGFPGRPEPANMLLHRTE